MAHWVVQNINNNMSKKTIVILIIVVAVLVLSAGIFLLFFTNPPIQKASDVTLNGNNYAPFGVNPNSTSTNQNTNPDNGTNTGQDPYKYTNNSNSPLIKISTAPIAGAEVFDKKITGNATTTSIVRYTERSTGHTQEFNRLNFTLSNASNTTIPSIYQAWWSGSNLLAQFIGGNKDLVKTFTASLPINSTTTSPIIGGYLPDNIYTLSVSPKGNRVFYITKGPSAQGHISNVDGSKNTTLLSFPFNEWNTQWPNESTITLTSRPSYNSTGYMYFLSATTGSMTKVLGDFDGFSTLTNPSLTYVLYSGSTNNTVSTAVYDIKTGKNSIFPAATTLAEKCVWSKLSKTTAYCAVPNKIPSASYPDDWYQGNISFVDNIYKVDIAASAIQLMYKLPTDQSIDAINLFLDAKEENLYFTNKNDYYLWGLTIKGLTPIAD